MPTVKTAISIDQPLLERIDRLAAELEMPRSRVLALAAEKLLRQHEQRKLLQAIDEACHQESEGERRLRRSMRQKHLDLVKAEW